jgi:putative endonuclease
VVARNWRCGDGELDIVATDADVLVGCEVKTRTTTRYGSPLEAVDPLKADRIHRLVRRWAAEHDHPYTSIRIDVIAVIRPRRGRAELRHLVGVS